MLAALRVYPAVPEVAEQGLGFLRNMSCRAENQEPLLVALVRCPSTWVARAGGAGRGGRTGVATAGVVCVCGGGGLQRMFATHPFS